MDEYKKLIERLRRIDALYDGASTSGERDAAGQALRKTAERLSTLKPPEPPTEYQFSVDNTWSRKLFLALLRRNGYRPYRYYRQRATTVMARLPPAVADSIWREFKELDTEMRTHLGALAETIIAEAVSSDTAEAEEVPMLT